jgi:hypothetical protein
MTPFIMNLFQVRLSYFLLIGMLTVFEKAFKNCLILYTEYDLRAHNVIFAYLFLLPCF